MQSNQAAVLNTLVRVQRFLDANKDALGTINDSGHRAAHDGRPRSAAECAEKARCLLDPPAKRDRIAAAGQARACCVTTRTTTVPRSSTS